MNSNSDCLLACWVTWLCADPFLSLLISHPLFHPNITLFNIIDTHTETRSSGWGLRALDVGGPRAYIDRLMLIDMLLTLFQESKQSSAYKTILK